MISLGDDDFIFSAQKNICYISTQHQEGKFQKRDVSRVTCLSKPITQEGKFQKRDVSRVTCLSKPITQQF